MILNDMSERQKQCDFMKALMLYEDTEERRRLEAKISKAERDEKCVWRVLFLVLVLELISFAGLGYSAVFMPEFFQNTKPLLVKLFCTLGLSAAICLLVFGGYWLWHREVLNGLHEECRRVIRAALDDRYKANSPSPATLALHERNVEVYQMVTAAPQNKTSVLSLPEIS